MRKELPFLATFFASFLLSFLAPFYPYQPLAIVSPFESAFCHKACLADRSVNALLKSWRFFSLFPSATVTLVAVRCVVSISWFSFFLLNRSRLFCHWHFPARSKRKGRVCGQNTGRKEKRLTREHMLEVCTTCRRLTFSFFHPRCFVTFLMLASCFDSSTLLLGSLLSSFFFMSLRQRCLWVPKRR